jgi:two-component system, NtrC family, nitrogen regulation sensor histidine kinase NtrY
MSNHQENLTPEQLQRRLRRRRLLLWALGITVSLMLAIIVSQQLWLWMVVRPDTTSDALVLYALSTLNFVAFVVFLFIFVRNILKLRRERQERQLGSKIKTRLLIYFISISFLPITAMAVFSYLFLNRSLEKWFYPPEFAQQANELRRQTLENRKQTLLEASSLLVSVFDNQAPADRQATLDQLVSSGQWSGAEIVGGDGSVKNQSRANLPSTDRNKLNLSLDRARKLTVQSANTFIDNEDFDVVTVRLGRSETLILAANNSVVDNLDGLMSDSVLSYQDLVKRQRHVRMLGLSTLGLMTLILLFVSSWVAIYLARGIATPIKALAEASKEIARGHLSHRVSTIADDELALLAESFNQMTTQLEENRTRIEAGAAELRDKNMALLERRDYIETVLQSLSTGVVSVDENNQITTLNAAASRMLGLSHKTENGRLASDLIGNEDWNVINRLFRRARRAGHATEQTQLELGGNGNGPLAVAMTATSLRNSSATGRGVVLVIEDLSELIAAQRAAAWSEVARRMAHEIKNPLTPIQLSAERIAKNYKRLPGNGSENGRFGLDDKIDEERVGVVIAECTETISREVAGLKAMVDEFSRFARMPQIRLESANLNDVVSQAVGLYEERLEGATIVLNLEADLPSANLDVEQLKRVFVNLIDNALNALLKVDNEKRITITTHHDSDRSLVIAEVADTGQGIEPEDFRRLFQPYFSRRDSGTGLGLAIVQRIILEHTGRIRAEKKHPVGAKFVIELPTAS